VESTVRDKKTGESSDRELALRLGSVMLHCLGGSGGEVLKTIEESGLSFVQMKALIALESPERLEAATVGGVAEQLGISAASASRAVDELFRRRLVSRSEDEHDRRVRRLELTGRGRAVADRIISARVAGLTDFTASLSADERRKLQTALDALLERDEIAEIYRTHARRGRR